MRHTTVALTVALVLTAIGGCSSSGKDAPSGTPTGTTVPAGSSGESSAATAPRGASSAATASRGASGGPQPTGQQRSADRGQGPRSSAATAFQHWVREWDGGQYGTMWRTLATAQRSLVPERRFAECQRDTLQQGGFVSIKYRRTVSRTDVDLIVPGTTRRVHSQRITAQVSLDGREPQMRTITMNWFADGADWRWALNGASVRAYRHDTCPR
jgi:hypothetical protein